MQESCDTRSEDSQDTLHFNVEHAETRDRYEGFVAVEVDADTPV